MSKTWFITGASSGFGRELAWLLLERGHRVAATVRKQDALQDLAAKYGERLWSALLDVTDGAAVRNVIDRAFAELTLALASRSAASPGESLVPIVHMDRYPLGFARRRAGSVILGSALAS